MPGRTYDLAAAVRLATICAVAKYRPTKNYRTTFYDSKCNDWVRTGRSGHNRTHSDHNALSGVTCGV